MNAGRKTILLLGGSQQQIIAIETAKRLGFRTVLCDYLPDNPGRQYANSFHLVSTTDREAVLAVAKAEKIDGILAYSSDPASPTAAYVAEKLGLPTNPLQSIEIMSTKSLFREHLATHGFPAPRFAVIRADHPAQGLQLALEKLAFPFVVKPTDSSGSKGVTIVRESAEIDGAISRAANFSRNKILIAEEYVTRSHPHVIGGDIFVLDGKVVFWGLMSCIRDDEDSLVPNGEMTPAGLSLAQYSNIRDVLQGLVTSLDIRFGELNVEIIISADDVPYVLELGSRAGGNMIPVQLSDASNIDLVAANVLCAMGADPGAISWESDGCCFATYVLHSQKGGTYGGYELSEIAQACLYREVLYRNAGDEIEQFDAANKALGILFFRFEDESQMNAMMNNAPDHIRVKVRGS